MNNNNKNKQVSPTYKYIDVDAWSYEMNRNKSIKSQEEVGASAEPPYQTTLNQSSVSS